MTSTTQNPSESEAQNKPGESPRSNPVCLEVNVTLRSLPTEANGLTQPIREDLKTVIVFDNGAVLRSTNNLPAGMTLILSNPSARDVVYRVVTGRSMPAVKGYVEIEFMEPVKDFWGIHQESGPASPSAPAAAPPAFKTPAPPAPVRPAQPLAMPPAVSSPASQETAAWPVTPPVRPVPAIEPPSRPASAALSGTPEFDEFPAPMGSMSSHVAKVRNEPKPAPPSSPAPTTNAKAVAEKPVMEYSHSEVASSSVANWTAPEPEPPAAKAEFKPPQEPVDAVSSAPVPTHDFMSKGLMAYEQPAPSTGTSAGRTPLVLGAAALVLAGVCGVVFFMHRGGGPTPVANAARTGPPSASQPVAPSSSTVPPAAAQSMQESAPPAPAAQSEPQPQAQAIAAQPVQPSVAVAPIPSAEIANAPAPEPRTDSRSARRQNNSAAAAKQSEAAAPKRPMISNLKMSAPSAPSKNIGDAGDAAPVAEIASADLPAGSTPATLLSSSGRTAGQPAPPAAPAPPPPPVKTLTEPKLISSTRPAYPMTARQSNIEGSVTVVTYIDPTGKVFSARALSGPVMLRAAAEEAVKQWKYSPALEDGKPTQSHVIVKVEFKIN